LKKDCKCTILSTIQQYRLKKFVWNFYSRENLQKTVANNYLSKPTFSHKKLQLAGVLKIK